MKRKNNTTLFRKIVKALPVFSGFVVVLCALLFIKDLEMPTVLPVNDVQVSGDLVFIDKNEIKSIVENNISGGYFTIDLIHVREKLIQQPWLKNVSLRRRWPDGVDVFVEERKAIAYWNDDGYISEYGHVFKPELIDRSLNLPLLNGPDGQHDNVWKFMNVLYKEMALLDYSVTSLDLDMRRAWQLKIMSNVNVEHESDYKVINVRLGRFYTEKRMQRFIRILPALASQKEFANNKIKVIDMRYPNGFAVRMTMSEA